MQLSKEKYRTIPCRVCGRLKVRPGRRICSGCSSRLRHGGAIALEKNKPFINNNQPVINSKDSPNEDQLVYLRAANAELESRIHTLNKILGKRKELADQVKAAVVAATPFTRFDHIATSVKSPLAIPVIKFSDWHIGEVINPEETEGFGGYDWEIAKDRLHNILNAFVKWIDTMRHGYTISECVVFGEGDYISGDIHRELSVTNEFPVPVQTAKAGLLFGEAISFLASNFDTVRVHQVGADNHGRLTPKPQFKQRYENSFSFLVNAIASASVAKHSNVKIIEAKGIKHIANVAGYDFLIEHGDTIKSWMGVPYYGIERGRAREATIRMGTDKEFDYMSIGHWHVPALVSGNIIINGSLSGTTEFDHGCGRVSRPSQVAFMVSPKHGIFNITHFWG